MTEGHVVSKPVREHECAPGWTWKTATEPGWFPTVPVGTRYGVPPTVSDYPAGTVWRCNCGQHWVSTGNDPWRLGPGWRPERRRERRRRLGLRWWQREAR